MGIWARIAPAQNGKRGFSPNPRGLPPLLATVQPELAHQEPADGCENAAHRLALSVEVGQSGGLRVGAEMGMEHEERQDHEGREGIPFQLETLARAVVDSGLSVHRALGPGLLESSYEQCLAHELGLRGVAVRRQVALPMRYKGLTLDAGYRIDMIVEDGIVIEVKAVEALTRLHQAQILTYLKLSGLRLGFLMTFNVELFRDGVRRLVR